MTKIQSLYHIITMILNGFEVVHWYRETEKNKMEIVNRDCANQDNFSVKTQLI